MAPNVVVLQSVPGRSGSRVARSDPSARFYVLSNHASLTGEDITHPRASTDQSGSPAVVFGFSARGKLAFRELTAVLAHRGNSLSAVGAPLNQHLAIGLDDRLITVPSVDFKMYPDGIPSDAGADMTGDFTVASARDLAIVLRYGSLSVALSPR